MREALKRRAVLEKLNEPELIWDMVVIGGGASGLGAALEAASRGYKTLLLEQDDFAKGTSSRSTKLVHGGVRYLAQGNIRLVLEALRERGLLKRNAPHLVRDQSFIIPCYKWWCMPFYSIGLTLYDLLSGRWSIGRSVPLSKQKVKLALPNIKTRQLKGGVRYYDCQFDDARLAINLCQSLFENGGMALNYARVTGLNKKQGRISGVIFEERESGKSYTVPSKIVINATGVFVDQILKLENPGAKDVVKPSQGIHLVMDREFLKGTDALMIPRTTDGRVLFAIPWHNRVVVGTTDAEKELVELEPVAQKNEIEYILETAGRFMEIPPEKEDIRSIFTGLRPLAAPAAEGKKTKEISRGHKILISKGGLITLTGGKWTTYRKMGEDVVNAAIKEAELPVRNSVSRTLKIHGFTEEVDLENPDYWYGKDLQKLNDMVKKDPEMGELLSEKLHLLKVQVIFAVREEFARTLEDVLSRRIRALQLDARESICIAPRVVKIIAQELGLSRQWESRQLEAFISLAESHLLEQT